MNSASVASQANIRRLVPNLPRRDLIAGPRENYLKIGVPLYEASIKCNWKAAEAILKNNPELVRYGITDNGETALHIAASAKGDPAEFVRKLVDLMEVKDLELENENFNTAMYLAATVGNVETVKIMVGKNKKLPAIPGAAEMLPLYAAALFGHYEVVKYLYENSNDLCDAQGWKNQTRGWLLEKCVENDMFDIALEIVKKYPKLGTETPVLGILAAKPEAFLETKSSIIEKTIFKMSKHLFSWMFMANQPSENKYPEPAYGSADEDLDQKPKVSPEAKSNFIRTSVKSVFAFISLKARAHKKENKALPLLKLIWDDIAKKHKKDIDKILRGPQNPIEQDESASGMVVQAIQLQKLIHEHLSKLEVEIQIIKGRFDSTTQVTDPPSAEVNHAQQLKDLISTYLVNLRIASQEIIKQSNTLVANKGDQALDLQKIISEHIVNMYHESHNLNKQSAPELQKFISRTITKMRDATALTVATTLKEATAKKVSYSSRVLFIAAEMGNARFLVELIHRYPDLMWKVNDGGESMFHIAVKHRHEGIYNILYEIGSIKNLITPIKDEDANNMLHLAGKCARKERLAVVSGAALQMQRELLWFKEVRSMLPPSYRERRNKYGLTPRELFTKEHTELITEGEKWMKETASQCMVVAALIATIVFAAAFTIPGGYNQNDGIPIFYRKGIFVVFVVADAISLFLSSASLLTFLSILTSRYAERDFVYSLPNKLMLGVSTLFLSITAMMVTFGVSFFILYHKEMKWIPIFISVFAVMPVLLYVVLQYHLLVDVIRSAYGSRYLFKPKRQFLFYVNPSV